MGPRDSEDLCTNKEDTDMSAALSSHPNLTRERSTAMKKPPAPLRRFSYPKHCS